MHRRAGHNRRSLELLESIAVQVEDFGHAPTTARLLWERSEVHHELGDKAQAVADAEAAYDEAMVAGDDIMAFQIATDLVYLLGTNVDGEQRARWWLGRAQMLQRRAPLEDEHRIGLMSNHAVMAAMHGQIDEAIAGFAEGAELARQTHNVEQYPTLVVNLAAAYANSERLHKAEEVLTEGLDVLQRWGVHETEIALSLRKTLAVAKIGREDFANGLVEIERLEAISAELEEPTSAKGGTMDHARGVALMRLNDFDGAIAAFDRAERWFGDRQGYPSQQALMARINRMRAEWLAGRLDAAAQTGAVALARCEHSGQCRRTRIWLGWVELARGRSKEALEHGRKADEIAASESNPIRKLDALGSTLIGHAALDLGDDELARDLAERLADRVNDPSASVLIRSEISFLLARLERRDEPQQFPAALGPALGHAMAGGAGLAATRRRVESWMEPRWGEAADVDELAAAGAAAAGG